MIIEPFVNYCFKHKIISSEDIPLFQYCIEKKIYSFLITIPLFFLGIFLSEFQITVSFLSSFFYLRSVVNGYHAQTLCGCFAGSIILEIIALKLVDPVLTIKSTALFLFMSFTIIWYKAPYNHPNMNLSPGEILACRESSHQRLIIVIVILLYSHLTKRMQIFRGMTLGIIFTAGLLNLAYVNSRRKNG